MITYICTITFWVPNTYRQYSAILGYKYIVDLASVPVYFMSSPWLDTYINSRDGETVSIPKPVQPQQIPAIPPQTLTPPQQWKPEVKPVGQVPSLPTQPGQTFTKTSLEANIPVGTLYTTSVCTQLAEARYYNKKIYIEKQFFYLIKSTKITNTVLTTMDFGLCTCELKWPMLRGIMMIY